jgi:hypothetical protein
MSDLLECIVGMGEDEIEAWADKTLAAIKLKGLPGLEYDLPDAERLFLSAQAPREAQEVRRRLPLVPLLPRQGRADRRVRHVGFRELLDARPVASRLDWFPLVDALGGRPGSS